MKINLTLLACPFMLGTLASCVSPGEGPVRRPYAFAPVTSESQAPYDDVSYWDGDGVPGAPRVDIRLGEQIAYFYKGDQLVGRSRIATGKEGHSTPTGNFRIIRKDQDYRSGTYGWIYDAEGTVINFDAHSRKDKVPRGGRFEGADMFYYMEFLPGYGMHKGPIPRPGQPESHGCVRMPEHMAAAFFANTSIGTPVRVMH